MTSTFAKFCNNLAPTLAEFCNNVTPTFSCELRNGAGKGNKKAPLRTRQPNVFTTE